MNENDNDNYSLMSTIFDTRTTYEAFPKEPDSRCICEPSENKFEVNCHAPKKEKLIAYIRAVREQDLEPHLREILQYCERRGYRVAQVFTDVGDHPSFGLQAAFSALDNSDGLISGDVNMFIKQGGDKIRELRPFIHHFFCLRQKHLITICDGIDTGTSMGQENAIALICQPKAGFET